MGLWTGQRWWLSQGWNCLEEEDAPWRREAVSTGLRHGPEYLRQSRANLDIFLTIIFGGSQRLVWKQCKHCIKWNVQIVVYTYILSHLPAPKLTVKKIHYVCMHNLLCIYVYMEWMHMSPVLPDTRRGC